MSVRLPQDGSRSASREPLRVGPYLLLERLAWGELAAVYSARADSAQVDAAAPPMKLAVKLLHAEHARDPERRNALRREAEISRLATPRGRVLAYVDGEQPYLVMELVDGASLSQLLTRSRIRGIDPTRYAVTVIGVVLAELDALHQGTWSTVGAPLIHQAPTARHILVGRDGRVTLTDFTLAISSACPGGRLANEPLRPEEMAPEQALAPAHVGVACDQFIIGIALWEALAGARLFAADSANEALEKLLRGPIRPPSELAAAPHPGLDRICLRALSRPRAERYPSLLEMGQALREESVKADLLAKPEEVAAWVTELLEHTPMTSAEARSAAGSTLIGVGFAGDDVSQVRSSPWRSDGAGARPIHTELSPFLTYGVGSRVRVEVVDRSVVPSGYALPPRPSPRATRPIELVGPRQRLRSSLLALALLSVGAVVLSVFSGRSRERDDAGDWEPARADTARSRLPESAASAPKAKLRPGSGLPRLDPQTPSAPEPLSPRFSPEAVRARQLSTDAFVERARALPSAPADPSLTASTGRSLLEVRAADEALVQRARPLVPRAAREPEPQAANSSRVRPRARVEGLPDNPY